MRTSPGAVRTAPAQRATSAAAMATRCMSRILLLPRSRRSPCGDKMVGMRSPIGSAACVAVILAAAFTVSGGAVSGQPEAGHERGFLTRVRRLTVDGRRAGEGYWSPDGKRLVFQSERDPANPFYQIYALDLSTGDVKRISSGIGKTTCAFFRPNSREILFSSTHLDPKS